jgi:hypothetical protein
VNSPGGVPVDGPVASLSLSLPTAAPFNLLATARLLQRRPRNRVDRWERGRSARLIDTDDSRGNRRLRVQAAVGVSRELVRGDGQATIPGCGKYLLMMASAALNASAPAVPVGL